MFIRGKYYFWPIAATVFWTATLVRLVSVSTMPVLHGARSPRSDVPVADLHLRNYLALLFARSFAAWFASVVGRR